MAERCSHVQCSAPATARVAFDSLACFVWIDPYESAGPRDVGARGAGALCTRHADRLVPPRGWAVQDRRAREPQLWSDRPPADDRPAPRLPMRVDAVAAPAGRIVVPAVAPVVVAVDDPLPFTAGPDRDPSRAHAVVGAAEDTGDGDPPDGDAPDAHLARTDLDALLTPTSPMLARAFNPARSGHAG